MTRDTINDSPWLGFPPGTVRCTGVTCKGPSRFRRLWLWLTGRKPAYLVTWTFAVGGNPDGRRTP